MDRFVRYTASLLVVVLTLSTAAVGQSCDRNKYPRKDCGYVGISEDKCIQDGCCWNPQDNQPWCFNKSTPIPATPTCLVDQTRYECGWLGITESQCVNEKGCCWNPADSQPWCFYKTGGTLPSQCKLHGPRFDCGGVGTTEEVCVKQSCCWDPSIKNQPWCFYQAPSYTVQTVEMTTLGVKMTLAVKSTVYLPYGPNISPLTFELWQETTTRLHFKISDPQNPRWEVPQSVLPSPPLPSTPPTSPLYQFQLPKVGDEFHIAVIRKSNQETLFNTTTVGSLQFANQYLSTGTVLPQNYNIYGLGERKSHLRLTPRNSNENCGNTYPLWNADIPTIPENFNLYGSQPFYLDLRAGGNAHGVFLKNSNGMDVVLGGTSLQYRVIGGVLDFYLFLGPDPEAVVQQYQEVIGRPQLPPYWSLGFHQCRYGYEDLKTLKEVVNGYNNEKIPLDVIWSDIDYMDGYRDFTLDPKRFPADEVQKFINTLHSSGLHYVAIVDPGIKIDKGYPAYDRGLLADAFFKDYNGNNYVGDVWPGKVHYPDFFNPKIQAYWEQELKDFFSLADVDGIWLDMNECANFCSGVCSENEKPPTSSGIRNGYAFNPSSPPYNINNRCYHSPLYIRTVAVDAEHYGGVLEYDAHNLYGMMESMSTKKALESIRPNKRAFVLTRANFAGTGSYAAHWNGDNTAHETDLYFSIPMMLSYQLFGMPFVGSDICGFFEDTTEELCGRWMQIGAFYPFARNHNFKGPIGQEPYRWPSVANISRAVLGIRYSLLPYYYTLFYKAHREVDGTHPPSATVVRPLFFEFPQDPTTYPIDWQFMVGSALLVSPVLRVGEAGRSVAVYFPSGSVWYDWYTGNVTSPTGGDYKTISTPLDYIPIHVRGGSIIPRQDPGLTSAASRGNLYSLMVALDKDGCAKGDIFLDDGEAVPVTSYTFVDYSVSPNQLMANSSGTGYAHSLPPLDRIQVFGVSSPPASVEMEGGAVPFSFSQSSSTLTIGPGLQTGMQYSYSIQWK